MIFINAQREFAEIQMRICQYHRPESRASLTDVRLSLTESSKSSASIANIRLTLQHQMLQQEVPDNSGSFDA